MTMVGTFSRVEQKKHPQRVYISVQCFPFYRAWFLYIHIFHLWHFLRYLDRCVFHDDAGLAHTKRYRLDIKMMYYPLDEITASLNILFVTLGRRIKMLIQPDSVM